MNLDNLANLVIVRNHLNVLCNNTNVVAKDDYKNLLKLCSDLDRKFLEHCKELDVDNLIGNFDTPVYNPAFLNKSEVKSEKAQSAKPKTSKKKPGRKPAKAKDKKEEKAEPKDAGHDDPEIAQLLAQAKQDPKVKAAKKE